MYARLMKALDSIGLLSGFCYTQFADTYQETNGLLDAARNPKISLDRIATATRGARPMDGTGMSVPGSASITPSPHPDGEAISQPDVN